MAKYLLLLLGPLLAFSAMPKEYYKLPHKESKKYFIEYMYSLIEKENIAILEDRSFVKNFLSSNVLTMNYSSPSFLRLLKLKKTYKIKNLFSKNEYLRKIDFVPPSQAIAQAAAESGWGRSRFIKEANNIFGHWTYNPKIGMMPENRDEEATHFIRIFKTLNASIKAYMLNLNRNRAYKDFQNQREKERAEGILPNGKSLSQTMLNYSGIGHNYLELLNDIIRANKLDEYDKKFYNKIKDTNK